MSGNRQKIWMEYPTPVFLPKSVQAIAVKALALRLHYTRVRNPHGTKDLKMSLRCQKANECVNQKA
jgi:hypothetical protein